MSFPPPTPGQARLIWLALGALAAAILAGVSAGVVWGLDLPKRSNPKVTP